MSIGSAIGGAIGLGNALIGNSAEKKAARAAQKAADENNARQQMVYNNARNDLGGYLSTGQNALTGLNALAGGDYSGFQNSPDYQFALSQGLQGVDRSAAARGALYSGGQQADLNDYAQGMASQNLGNYRNNLLSLAGMGQNAAGTIAGVGQNTANAQSQNTWGAANAQGNSAMNQASNLNQLLAGIGGEANKAWQGRQSSFGGGSGVVSPRINAGVGSSYGFGNNVNNLINWGGA